MAAAAASFLFRICESGILSLTAMFVLKSLLVALSLSACCALAQTAALPAPSTPVKSAHLAKHSREARAGNLASEQKDLEAAFARIKDPHRRIQVGLQLVRVYRLRGHLHRAARLIAELRQQSPQSPDLLYAAYRVDSELVARSMAAKNAAVAGRLPARRAPRAFGRRHVAARAAPSTQRPGGAPFGLEPPRGAVGLNPAIEGRQQSGPRARRYPGLCVRSPVGAARVPVAGMQLERDEPLVHGDDAVHV